MSEETIGLLAAATPWIGALLSALAWAGWRALRLRGRRVPALAGALACLLVYDLLWRLLEALAEATRKARWAAANDTPFPPSPAPTPGLSDAFAFLCIEAAFFAPALLAALVFDLADRLRRRRPAAWGATPGALTGFAAALLSWGLAATVLAAV